MIQSVNSNTSLTLDKPFAETTATNSNYRILLNTATHFPSDTAAKVERALEQLSDINEAAINNDRTVTAATKVNGKGLSSTMGDIHLNPASVNTNRGGTINFHYNQSSSATSSIYEDASGSVRVNGTLKANLTGNVTGYSTKLQDVEFNSPTDKDLFKQDSGTIIKTEGGSVFNTPEGNAGEGTVYTAGASILIGSTNSKSSSDWTRAYWLYGKWNNTGLWYGWKPNTSDQIIWKRIALASDRTGTIGSADTPVYLSSGTITSTGKKFSDYLPLSGGYLTGNIYHRNMNITSGTAPSNNIMFDSGCVDSGNRFMSLIRAEYNTNKSSETSIRAFNTTTANNSVNIGRVGVGCDSSGHVYTVAPTPATSDNSTQIATTAFVNSFNSPVSLTVAFNGNAVYDDKSVTAYRINKLVVVNGYISSKVNGTGLTLMSIANANASKLVRVPIMSGPNSADATSVIGYLKMEAGASSILFAIRNSGQGIYQYFSFSYICQ